MSRYLRKPAALCFALTLCLTLTACDTAIPSAVSSAESGNPQSPSSGGIVTPPSSKPDTSLSEMGYEEYFSKERAWVDESGSDELTYVHEVNADGTVSKLLCTFLDDGEVQRTKTATITLKEGAISEYTIANDSMLFVVDKIKIVQTDLNGAYPKIIHEDTQPISYFIANSNLCFFLRGEDRETLCRLHRQSGIIDEIVHAQTAIDSFSPVSNYTVTWGVETIEWKQFLAAGGTDDDWPYGKKTGNEYLTNSNAGETRPLTDADYTWDGYLLYEIEK